MPLVSVVIPTFNRSRRVVSAVESVLKQEFRDFEVLVVDDGSTDETGSIVSAMEEPVKLISHPFNCGVSAARNTGIRCATGTFIAFLDSDDVWRPGKLAAQVSFCLEHPECLACQCNETWIRNGRRVNPKNIHRKPSGNIFFPSLKRCLVSPSSVMLHRRLFFQVGLFDERLPACEDYDLWLRIACRHAVFLLEDELTVRMGGHGDQLSARYAGMDRFRIRSLVKLLVSGVLSPIQEDGALAELEVKCRIYGDGCRKRGREAEGLGYLGLPEILKQSIIARNGVRTE